MAQFSTILTQAWCSGKSKIIIDDYSNPNLAQALVDREYIFTIPEHNATLYSSFKFN